MKKRIRGTAARAGDEHIKPLRKDGLIDSTRSSSFAFSKRTWELILQVSAYTEKLHALATRSKDSSGLR